MTLYLKYRPQTIAELDLTSVREQLQKILASGHVPHAFLFAGPRGAGKTSSARIIAKAVNCENPPAGGEPCNKCSQCIAITKGTSLDVIEIDAASNRGVDDIRSLREAVKLATSGAKKKVYIIDEAHMLTTEASNALLKTLEEPPEHVIFVLATTAPEKLLDTIKSRCTTLHFIKASAKEVVQSLKRAAVGEKMKLEDGGLEEIAKNVDGSFREAHKILEQLGVSGTKITVEDVQKLAGLAGSKPEKLLEYLVEKDTKGAIEEIDKVVQQGTNLRTYSSELVGNLRRMLLMKIGDGQVELKTEELQNLIELFSQAAKDIPTSVIPQLPLEMAIISWCNAGEGEVVSRVVSMSSETRSEDPSPQPIPDPQHTTQPHPNLDEAWREIMLRVKAKNHSAEALLRAARPEAFDGKVLRLEVFYKFHKERLEGQPYRAIIEAVVGEVLGGQKVVCILSGTPKRAADIMNVSEAVQEDIVKAAEDIFGGGSSTDEKLVN